MRRYGEPVPPALSLDSLKTLDVPVSLFVGTHDILATIKDVHDLRDEVLGPDTVYQYEEVNAGHISFLVGKDMSYFNDKVMSTLREH